MEFFNLGIGSTIKWIIIGILGISLIGSGAWLVNTIQENAVNNQKIQTLTETINKKDVTIDGLRKQLELTNTILEERDKEINNLNEQLNGLTENLGDDANDVAPQSVREYIRRLRERLQ